MTGHQSENFAGTERFTVLRQIGAGGMGVVYEAHDRERNERLALKTLARLSPELLYYLKQEFRSLTDVTHPNLVALYELFSVGEQWFFTMELISGVNFLEYVGRERQPSFSEASTASHVVAVEGRSETVHPSSQTVPSLEHRPGKTPLGHPAGKPIQLDRLRAALVQLAEGVCALHAAGKLHRDIKPSNVLVTSQGRVVLLDFGLVTELERPLDRGEQEIAGTTAYMAPEQAAGRPLSPASDWYAVGVMLYEALTGQPPFSGGREQVLREKQLFDPLPPQMLMPETPDDLNELCMELLRRPPEARPSGAEILGRLMGGPCRPPASPAGPVVAARSPFVGRERHLEALWDAYRTTRQGRAVTVYVHGRSGVGKSLLVQRFLENLVEREEVVVLAGRCYERESVPYKALDSLVDALSRYLGRLPWDEAVEVIPQEVTALARLFPVLRRVATRGEGQPAALDSPDPQELRRRAFRALRELLARLASRRPTVLTIDDLQWGDVDSAALLADLLRPPDPPAVLVLGAYRSEYAETSGCLRALLEAPRISAAAVDQRELAVEPLAAVEARSLALELLGPFDAAGPARAEAIARESGGIPYFVHELVQHVRGGVELAEGQPAAAEVRLDEVLWKRVCGLPEASRRLLEIVTVSGQPLCQGDAYRAAALGTEGRAAVAVLRMGHLVRSTGPGDQDEVETYHDRIRESVVAHLPRATLQNHHQRLAVVLEESEHADPETLAAHFQEASEPAQAGHYYAMAAAEAAEALAFDRAAKLYRLSLELRPVSGTEGRELRTKLGDALANAGRGLEAARAYQTAASGASAADTLELQRRAAFQYCISGHLDEGREAFRTVLGAVGLSLPPTPRRALFGLLLQRALLRLRGIRFRERDAAQVSADELRRIDITRSVAVGISVMDPICGAGFQTRSLLLALRAGEPLRIALALAWETAHAALAGGSGRRRTARLLEEAGSLARRLNHPHALGMATLAAGITEFFLGHFPAAREHSERAEQIFRARCTGVPWELDTAHAFGLWSLLYMGELAQLRRRFFVLFKEAQERGDRYDAANLGTQIGAIARLAADEVDEAGEQLREVMDRWTHHGFNIQHLSALYGQVYLDLYTGRGEQAWQRIAGMWSACRESFLLRIQQVRIDVLQLSGRSALAAACGADPEPLLRVAAGYARGLEREGMPWSVALARLIQAGVAARRGDQELAVRLFAEAAVGFDAVPMGMFAAAARRRQGELLGGAEGRALIDAANCWMKSQQIQDLTRMTAAFAPPVSV